MSHLSHPAYDCLIMCECEEITLREYFKKLLKCLWIEGEGFSGKRPFGDSGWDWDIYSALVKGGFINGSLDSDGHIIEFDEHAADKLVFELIEGL